MPIRILHFIGSLAVGGEQRYLIRLANTLSTQRFEQTVFYGRDQAMASEFAPHVTLLRGFSEPLSGWRPRDWMLTKTLASLIRAGSFDLVATHCPGVGQLAASAAAKICDRPVVHTIQRPFQNRSRTESLIAAIPPVRAIAYALTDRFVALGSYYAEDQNRRWRIPSQKIHTSYIGVDLDEWQPRPHVRLPIRHQLSVLPSVPLLGIIARHSPEKAVDRGIEMFGSLLTHIPDARLLLVGDGPTRAALEDQVRRNALEHAVIFAGPRRDTCDLMNACDVVVQTTKHPLNGISSIEAMAVGRPVITVVDAPFEEEMAADTCIHGVNGLYFRRYSRDASVRELTALLQNKARIDALGEASRRLAEERFDIASHTAQIEQLYTSLVRPF